MRELEKTMYYNAHTSTIVAARLLRSRMNKTESIVWEKLNRKQICNVRFRRQHPIDIFIADFYCHSAKLVIEIDGEIHNFQRQYDIGRTAEMNKYDILVIRFTDEEVLLDIDRVIDEIKQVVLNRI
ncbi:MAG: DUF559 domain-containing protein [Bacteroidales bacterium]